MAEQKPLAKSLHTVTVLVLIARDMLEEDRTMTPKGAVFEALRILKLIDKPDTYGLAEQAIKQLSA